MRGSGEPEIVRRWLVMGSIGSGRNGVGVREDSGEDDGFRWRTHVGAVVAQRGVAEEMVLVDVVLDWMALAGMRARGTKGVGERGQRTGAL
jgi:hypothetical protein